MIPIWASGNCSAPHITTRALTNGSECTSVQCIIAANATRRILVGKDYKRLEFFGTHDENSHGNDASKKLKYNQIGAIYDSVLIAPKQSATQLRRNLMQAKGSPDKHLHMDPAQLRLIQRRVWSARQELTKQKLGTATVPESLGSSLGGVRSMTFMQHWPSTMTRLTTIVFHSSPHLSLVATSNQNVRSSISICRRRGF